jgi:tRNA pseudouridine38-40 synthase
MYENLIMRYFVRLTYKGTNYHGWQYQPNARSVQEELEKAFSTILKQKTSITGAGRTDAGVHAKKFIAHFDMENAEFANNLDQMTFKLNSLLPYDISIEMIWPVNKNAHARFDATKRTYHYFISYNKNPFLSDTAWFQFSKLDIDLMNKAGEILMQNDDFTSFAKLHTDNKTNICDLMHAEWTENKEEGYYKFEISANRFLRNMVRSIVGSMVDLGRGKANLDDFRSIIAAKDRSKGGISAPAKGLFLVKIEYPSEIMPK